VSPISYMTVPYLVMRTYSTKLRTITFGTWRNTPFLNRVPSFANALQLCNIFLSLISDHALASFLISGYRYFLLNTEASSFSTNNSILSLFLSVLCSAYFCLFPSVNILPLRTRVAYPDPSRIRIHWGVGSGPGSALTCNTGSKQQKMNADSQSCF